MVLAILRLYSPPLHRALYKDIGKCSNFKAKLYGYFPYEIIGVLLFMANYIILKSLRQIW